MGSTAHRSGWASPSRLRVCGAFELCSERHRWRFRAGTPCAPGGRRGPSMAGPSQTCFPQTPKVSVRVEAQPATGAGAGRQLAVAVVGHAVMRSCSFETSGTGLGSPGCASNVDRPECGGQAAAGVPQRIDCSAVSPSSQLCLPRLVPETLPRLSQADTPPAVWAVQGGQHRCLRRRRNRRAGRRSRRST